MCTRDKEFTIRGIGDCLARGYDRTGFFIERTVGAKTGAAWRPGKRRTFGWIWRASPARRNAGDRAAAGSRRLRAEPLGSASAMRRRRRTKVVATLGPASSDRVTIERLFAAGADVFRINMSHTNPGRMRELVTTIRAIETEHGRPIGVLVDLQGPKLRLGTFKDGAAEIDTGQDFSNQAGRYDSRRRRQASPQSNRGDTATDRGAC